MARSRWAVLLAALVLVVATACERPWVQARYDPGGTGFNSADGGITTMNLGSIAGAAAGAGPRFDAPGPWATPVVSGGSIFVAAAGTVRVHTDCAPAAGTTTCPLAWTADLGPGATAVDAPAVGKGRLLVVTAGPAPALLAFDAAGVEGCGGTPKVCAPLWSTPGGGRTGPTYRDGVVFVSTDDRIQAIDAAGVQGCAGTPKVCAPLWSSVPVAATGLSRPSVGPQGAFVTDVHGEVLAYDAAGTRQCGGVPKTCAPLWTTAGPWVDQPVADTWPAPVLFHGHLFVETATAGPGDTARPHLAAYDTTTQATCTAAPVVCPPIWETAVPGVAVGSQLAVAYTTVFVLSRTGSAVAGVDPEPDRLSGFATDGAGCGGAPMSCPVTWTASAPGGFGRASSPSAAAGLLYQPADDGLAVFDADGDSCPVVAGAAACDRLRTIGPGPARGNVALANGRLYALDTAPFTAPGPVDAALAVLRPS